MIILVLLYVKILLINNTQQLVNNVLVIVDIIVIMTIMFGIKTEILNNVHKEQIVTILFQKRHLLNMITMNVKKTLVLM